MSANNTTPTNEVWVFDHTKLQEGDVVLERGRDPQAGIIAAATLGHFSHALMWIGNGNFIEAMPTGVRVLQSVRVPLTRRSDWQLLRLGEDRAGRAKAAALFARNHSFKQYDFDGAARSWILPRSAPLPGALFCSQLVAEAYRSVGVELVPGKVPSAISPNDLARSPVLEKLELPLAIPHPQLTDWFREKGFDRSALYEESFLSFERDLTKRLFAAVADRVEQVSWPEGKVPGSLGELIDVLSFIDTVLADPIADTLLFEMEATGYFHLLSPAISELIATGAVSGRKDLIAGYLQSRTHHGRNSTLCLAAHARHPHQLWTALHDMYLRNAMGFDILIKLAKGEAPYDDAAAGKSHS